MRPEGRANRESEATRLPGRVRKAGEDPRTEPELSSQRGATAMSPRLRAPGGAGQFRRMRGDVLAAHRFDLQPLILPRRTQRAAPTSAAGPGAPRGPKGSASPRPLAPS